MGKDTPKREQSIYNQYAHTMFKDNVDVDRKQQDIEYVPKYWLIKFTSLSLIVITIILLSTLRWSF